LRFAACWYASSSLRSVERHPITLGTAQLTAVDVLTIELVETDEHPTVVIIRWPDKPSVIQPRRFPDAAATHRAAVRQSPRGTGRNQNGAKAVITQGRRVAIRRRHRPDNGRCAACGETYPRKPPLTWEQPAESKSAIFPYPLRRGGGMIV
jgi:hypothetical protein